MAVSYDDADSSEDEEETGRQSSSPVTSRPIEDETEPTGSAPLQTVNDKSIPTVNERKNTISLQALRVDPAAPPLLMIGLVEHAASKIVVRARKGISQGFVNEEEEGRGRCLQTAGVNFAELWRLDSVDNTRLMSNDIWAVRCAYGVEAARGSIVQQIKSVFGAYGIEVDNRHLSLIADYMTFDGGYKAMNRIGMEGSSSPFLRMSFETTCHFLRQAALENEKDDLSSPSGNIVLGCPVNHGTGAFDLLAANA
jgi:DNA-directed RNA polymerase I subunit RPA1